MTWQAQLPGALGREGLNVLNVLNVLAFTERTRQRGHHGGQPHRPQVRGPQPGKFSRIQTFCVIAVGPKTSPVDPDSRRR